MLKTLAQQIGHTRLCELQRLGANDRGNTIVAKLEGDNPAGSVKDRPAANMIAAAEHRGDIKPGDTLIEATSGNTGIALAMSAAIRGYKMRLIMPENLSEERKLTMSVYGAELISVTKEQGMEYARDLALKMQSDGEGIVLDQFANPDNPAAHYISTGPEIWHGTDYQITHFVSSMGTTGTIMGVSRYLKEQNPDITIVGVQPSPDSEIPGIRRWPEAYLPKIYEPDRVDEIIDVSQREAERFAREMARQEGIFCGVSSGGAMAAALRISEQVSDSLIVTIVCDRGDRYLSTGVFG
ncbi:cysteine synthase B [Chromatiales bacterium (ex Bugula neritina AB1)]|nr:cysteine synthase B [Chromatiales bacterium (ex Bugula neritina AB1)]